MRTVDVARRAGCSVQQVRNLERDGVLPPAARTAAGYRIYTEPHVRCALAYRALAAATGPVEAKRIMRAAHGYPASDLLALLDVAHARLDMERRALKLAKHAAQAIAAEPIEDVRPSDSMGISELAVCARGAAIDIAALGRRRARRAPPSLHTSNAKVLT